jgi:hypothetical protein
MLPLYSARSTDGVPPFVLPECPCRQYLEDWSFGHAQRRGAHVPGVFHREAFVFVLQAQFALCSGFSVAAALMKARAISHSTMTE